jgi:orotate phosphoribosyltransferase
MNPAILVDDIIRSGHAVREGINLLKDLGVEVIGVGTIVRFEDGPTDFDGIPVRSLLTYDVNFYSDEAEWKRSRNASDAEEEKVRF